MKRKKVIVVHDWKNCHRWWSVRFSASGFAFMWGWDNLDKLKEYVPLSWLPYIAMGLFALIFVTRFVNQGANERNDKSNSEPS